ncbi:MAG: HxsD-like protein [Myxococcales bacterium]|nr:HxsD-like protein [Myxococcales bacterium]
MIELRFDPELYSAEAIEGALVLYGDFAELSLDKQVDAYVVRLASRGEHPEQVLADEFANYCLGATIETRPD